jgi:hypothetical protein
MSAANSRLIVDHPAWQQRTSVTVDHHNVAVSLPSVDTDPALLNSIHHLLLRSVQYGSPIDKLTVRSLGSDEVADLNQRSSRQRASSGQSNEAITGRKLTAIPDARGSSPDARTTRRQSRG